MIQVDTIDEVEPHLDSVTQLEISCMKAVIFREISWNQKQF